MDAKSAKKRRHSKYTRKKKGEYTEILEDFLTNRDKILIRYCGLFRVVWANDLVDTLHLYSDPKTGKPYSKKKTRERISLLIHNRYLDFTNYQPAIEHTVLRQGTGTLPAVVALGDRGTSIFFDMVGTPAPTLENSC